MSNVLNDLVILQEFYAKYGDEGRLAIDAILALHAKDKKRFLDDINGVAGGLLSTFGFAGFVPLIQLSEKGIVALIHKIKASGQEWTPEMVHAEVLRLKAEDDALDKEFDPPIGDV